MKAQRYKTETAENRAKKAYTKPVFNKFGQVADLTTGGSGIDTESNAMQTMRMP